MDNFDKEKSRKEIDEELSREAQALENEIMEKININHCCGFKGAFQQMWKLVGDFLENPKVSENDVRVQIQFVREMFQQALKNLEKIKNTQALAA